MDFLVSMARRANAASAVRTIMKSVADHANSALVAVARRTKIFTLRMEQVFDEGDFNLRLITIAILNEFLRV